jgi:uncharacterized protein YjbI with pentapeptide repeats
MIEKFEVRNRWTGAVQFTAEIETTPDMPVSWKLRLAVIWACKNGVGLRGADLRGVNLSWTELNGDDLSGADLSGANLNDDDLSEAKLAPVKLIGAGNEKE